MIMNVYLNVGIVKGIQNLSYTAEDQAMKVCEESDEVYEAVTSGFDPLKIAEECCDTITACVGLMYRLGFDSKGIARIMDSVTNKNKARGYINDEL